MQHLTETHKVCLKALVKMVRDQTIAEEFRIFYIKREPVIPSKDSKTSYKVTGLSRLGLESLTRSGFLFSLPVHEKNVETYDGKGTEQDEEVCRDCYITPDGFRAVDNDFAPVSDLVMHRPPIELASSLAAFRKDFPDNSRLAFVMMRFGKTDAHANIIRGIRRALDPQRFIALRADDKQYHDDLLLNILTYIYGCRFGVAVYERIESDEFNPNISYEVGYMAGIGKSVCFLKDKTLRALHSDLMGKLYCEFDTHNCDASIPPVLGKWMLDKSILAMQVSS